MGQFFDEPKFPVIDRAPGFWKTVGNYNWKDYALIAGITGACCPFGYVTGRSAGVQRPSMYTAATLGFTAAFMLAYQNSSGRLMGFFPNDKEVEAGLSGRQSLASD